MNDTAELQNLKRLEPLLACPSCGKPMLVGAERITCTGCNAGYPLYEGVALLALMGTPAAARQEKSDAGESSDPYQQQYQDLSEAAEYNAEY